MFLHIGPEKEKRFYEILIDRILVNAQLGGDLLIAKTFQPAQLKDLSSFFRQKLDALQQLLVRFLVFCL